MNLEYNYSNRQYPKGINGYAKIAQVTFDELDVKGVTFSNNSKVANVTFSANDNVRDITFTNNSKIAEVVFEDCASIENLVFTNNSKISRIIFRDCVSVGNLVFTNNNKITEVVFEDCVNVENVAFSNNAKVAEVIFKDCANVENIVGVNPKYIGCANVGEQPSTQPKKTNSYSNKVSGNGVVISNTTTNGSINIGSSSGGGKKWRTIINGNVGNINIGGEVYKNLPNLYIDYEGNKFTFVGGEYIPLENNNAKDVNFKDTDKGDHFTQVSF